MNQIVALPASPAFAPPPPVVALPTPRGLSRWLNWGEAARQCLLHLPGAAPAVVTLGEVLARYPEEDRIRTYARDYLPLTTGAKWWILGGGTARLAVRRPYTSRPGVQTPWGASDGAYAYGPGVVFHFTPSHGGFRLDARELASIPANVLAATYQQQGARGWFEEDEDCNVVVLAFPDMFDAADIARAADRLAGEGALRAAAHWRVVAEAPETLPSNRLYAQAAAAKLEARRRAVLAWNPPALRPCGPAAG